MAQFDVYRLSNRRLVVDVQSPVATIHGTRLVIPLVPIDEDASVIGRLNPQLNLNGQPMVLAIQFMSTLDAKLLKSSVGSLVDEEWAIKGALDFLINGF